MIRNVLDYEGRVVGQLELPDDTSDEIWEQRLAKFSAPPPEPLPPEESSFAADRAGEDQDLRGANWEKILARRLLWDLDSGFSVDDSNFHVPADGIYNYDFQMRLSQLSNVGKVEVALFKHTEGEEDDFWFTLKKETVPNEDDEIHLGGMTQFDFLKDEQYFIAVYLTSRDGGDCSAVMLGSDDYTAWGASYSRSLKNSYRA
jgi:hypothetical protein